MTTVAHAQPAPQEAAQRTKRKSHTSGLTCSVILGLVLGLGIFGALVPVGGLIYFQQTDMVLPGVSVLGKPVGGLSAADASQTLAQNWQANPPTIMLSTGQDNWPVSATVLGIVIDSKTTANRALELGRTGDVAAIGETVWNGFDLPPTLTFAPDTAKATLQEWATKLDVPAQDAGFKIENGQVITVPAQSGQRLDVDATVGLLASNPAVVLHAGRLPLILSPVAAQVTDVSAAVAQVQQLLGTPISIKVYDAITNEWFDWSPTPEVMAGWLSVANGQQVVVAPDKLDGFVSQQNQSLGANRWVDTGEAAGLIQASLQSKAPITLIAHHGPTTYTVQAGDNLTRIGFTVGMPYWRIVNANPGLDVNGISAGQVLTIPSKDELLPLPIVPNKRLVVSISAQRLWVYENGQQIHEFVISTGIDRSPTQPGVFQVQMHDPNAYASIWDLYMPNFLGIYEAWPGFMNGFHGLPLLSNGVRLWGSILGKPASYGCIILSLDDAQTLYDWAENGVVVEIQP